MISLTKPCVLYSAWFCPYAQRVWMALGQLRVPFELVESLDIDPLTQAYVKHPDLVRHNPKGLVPTVVQQDTVYCDSLVILSQLFGKDQFPEAKEWNARICSVFYRVLLRQDPGESLQAWKDLQAALHDFSQHLEYRNGEISFYDKADQPGMIDLTVFPFVHRLYIIEHYKGCKLNDQASNQKLVAWEARMEQQPFVQNTLATRNRLIPIYARYADGTAKSQVADSVRSGKNAHDV